MKTIIYCICGGALVVAILPHTGVDLICPPIRPMDALPTAAVAPYNNLDGGGAATRILRIREAIAGSAPRQRTHGAPPLMNFACQPAGGGGLGGWKSIRARFCHSSTRVIASVRQRLSHGRPQQSQHQRPYDNSAFVCFFYALRFQAANN